MTTVKRLISIFLLFGILSNCLNYWALSATYTLNKAYISSVLCTNKDKPELHCEGKCFMDIKLKELEQKNKHEQENLKRIIETVAPIYVNLLQSPFETTFLLTAPHYLQQKPIEKVASIFQPPKNV